MMMSMIPASFSGVTGARNLTFRTYLAHRTELFIST